MFSIKHRLRWSAVALFCAVGLGSSAWAATVVISASGPSARSYPAGKSLAAGSRIVLAAGDTLTVLDSRGTRTLRGPLNTSAEATAARATSSFAALVATQNRSRPRTGAIRGTGEKPKPANIWDIDSTSDGLVCVANAGGLKICRPDMKNAATMTVTPDGGAATRVSFTAGSNVAAWPAGVPVSEGRGYVINGGGLARPARVRFTLVDAPVPSDPAGIYMVLDAKGCSEQKQLVVDAMTPKPAGS